MSTPPEGSTPSQPQPQNYPTPPVPAGQPAEPRWQAEARDIIPQGLVGRLTDLSFTSFVTPTLIKILYILLAIFAALFALAIFVSLATQGVGSLILGLIVAPLLFVLYIVLARVYMEILIVIFRIAEYTREIAQNSRTRGF
jgi:hypothetical protein